MKLFKIWGISINGGTPKWMIGGYPYFRTQQILKISQIHHSHPFGEIPVVAFCLLQRALFGLGGRGIGDPSINRDTPMRLDDS